MNRIKIIITFIMINLVFSNKILIPMDENQSDHIKAYGIAFINLKKSVDVEWLLNYRGGSFLFDDYLLPENQSVIIMPPE